MSPWAQPAPLSPHKHLRDDRGSIAVEEFYDVEELQQIETALPLLVWWYEALRLAKAHREGTLGHALALA
jgi:hypothetical protein